MCVFTAVATIRTRPIMCMTFHSCMLTYTIAAFTVLYVEKTWVQKKE